MHMSCFGFRTILDVYTNCQNKWAIAMSAFDVFQMHVEGYLEVQPHHFLLGGATI